MGFGVPLGELMLVFVLLGLNIPRVLSRMSAAAILAPFLLWWGWGLTRLVFDAAAHGAWALRDATQLIDRKSVVEGKSVSVLVDLGGRRYFKQKKKNINYTHSRYIIIPHPCQIHFQFII